MVIKMAIRERLSGNEAVAYAIKQINPDVMPAFPITPSTEIPQYVATYIAMERLIQNLFMWKVNTAHECDHRSISSRSKSSDSHFFLRYGTDVGGIICGSIR